MTTAPQPVLEVEGIHTFYGTIEALKGISLEVREGEIVTLIGANGAGKSTTLRSINGLNHPRDGTIRFMGEDITHAPAHKIVKRGISQSPEGRKLFSRMSVEENLEMGRVPAVGPRGDRGRQGARLRALPAAQGASAPEGGDAVRGEQQMCAIGRAMMARPKLLMLDEPSMGLAPIFVDRIFETIVEINKEGTPVLLVEQNALMALDVATEATSSRPARSPSRGSAKELAANEDVKKAYLGIA